MIMDKKSSKGLLRFLLCGGGTGGHVYPALAIADALKDSYPGSEFLFVGSPGNIEARVVPQHGYPIRFTFAEPFPSRKNLWRFLKMSIFNAIGTLQAIRILLSFRPHLLIAMGGYVAAPAVFAWFFLKKAKLLKTPCLIHEQNVIPGKMNRLAGALADCVGISFAESAASFPSGKPSLVGYPVRQEIKDLNKEKSRKELGINPHHNVILAFGGSQGSRAINRGVVEALSYLSRLEGMTLIHATGLGREGWDYDPRADTAQRMAELGLRKTDLTWYRQIDYIDHIAPYYAASDLVICRAGAGTLNEIMMCGLPSIIVPKADLASDHQVHNAMALQQKGAAEIIFEYPAMYNGRQIFEVKGKELAAAIERLLCDPGKLCQMGHRAKEMAFQNASVRIVQQIQALFEGKGVLFPPLVKDKKKQELNYAGLSLDRVASLLKSMGQDKRDLLSDMDRGYIQYKVDLALGSENFLSVCRGARVAGLIGYVEKLPRLLEIMEGKKPAPWWQRLLGGDLVPVGFVRRDIMEGLQWMGIWNDSIHRLLHLGLEDPYFETRAAAARAAAALAPKIPQPAALESQLRRCLSDSNVEVVWESLRALGKISRDPDFLNLIAAFHYHPSWKIRKAAIEAMADLLKRKVVTVPQVCAQMEDFLTTCSDFKPAFPLTQSMLELKNLIKSVQEGDSLMQ